MPEQRPTPASDSPLTSSLYRATTNIDDLTRALTNFSRVPSPEPPSVVICCCGREDCEHSKSWLAVKSKLESRLILSAGKSYLLIWLLAGSGLMYTAWIEVGQALLQRHEAYVRRNEVNKSISTTRIQLTI